MTLTHLFGHFGRGGRGGGRHPGGAIGGGRLLRARGREGGLGGRSGGGVHHLVTPAAHDHDEDGEHGQDGAADHRRDDDQEGDALWKSETSTLEFEILVIQSNQLRGPMVLSTEN